MQNGSGHTFVLTLRSGQLSQWLDFYVDAVR